MKQFLYFLAAALYSLILTYFLWFGFLHLDYWAMTFGWKGTIFFIIVGVGFAVGIATFVLSALAAPLMYLIKRFRHAKWLPLLFIILGAVSSLRLPWLYYEHYTAVNIVMALSIDLLALDIFGLLFFSVLGADKLIED